MTSKPVKPKRRKNWSLAKWKQDAKQVFQRWARIHHADDNGYVTCCTCNTRGFWQGDNFHGGHFIPALKLATCFDERNVHPQCGGCNTYSMVFRDTLHAYYEFMEQKYGKEVVEELRQKRHQNVKYKWFDYQEIIEHYTDATIGELTKRGLTT